MTPTEILSFWFSELSPAQWWKQSATLDQILRQRFSSLHNSAAQGELYHWRETTTGRLAEIIVLDQFSRNIYRDQALAFAFDGMAIVLAQEMVKLGHDQKLSPVERSFCYMPYMHSESKIIHEQAVLLFETNGIESNIKFEQLHKKVIDRFGRYPHRNSILKRTSTPEELAFLREHSGF